MSLCFDKSVENRLAAIEGHVRAVKTMIADQKPCEDILLQLSAIEASVNKVAKGILKEHLNHCVKESIEHGESNILDKFNTVLDKYI